MNVGPTHVKMEELAKTVLMATHVIVFLDMHRFTVKKVKIHVVFHQ